MGESLVVESARNIVLRMLLEISMVATIVIILAGIAANSFGAARRHAHFAAMMAELRSLIPLQETYWSEGIGLARGPGYADLEDLERDLPFESTPGVSLAVRGGPRGWTAEAKHRDLGVTEVCAIYLGDGVEPFRPAEEPGLIRCTPKG